MIKHKTDAVYTFQEVPAEKSSIEEWNRFVLRFPYYHFMQSWQWAEFKKKFGWEGYHLALYKNSRIKGAVNLSTPCRMFLKDRLYSSPGGVVLDQKDKAVCKVFFSHLNSLLKQRKASFLKLSSFMPEKDKPILSLLENFNIQPSKKETYSIGLAQIPSTLVIDLNKQDKESIKKKFHIKTVQCIDKSYRDGLEIKPVKSEEDLAVFYTLLLSTAGRKKFMIHPFSYYREFYNIFCREKHKYNPYGKILLALHKGKVIAARSGIIFGRRLWELNAGSDIKHLRMRPNHRLVYELIKWAIDDKCRYYDFNGVITEKEQPGQRDKFHRDLTEGLAFFKARFGGDYIKFIPEHDLVLSRGFHRIWNCMIPGIKLHRKISEFLGN